MRGIRAKERVEQVGEEFSSELYKSATAAEQACLLELSRLGRRAGQLQVAFNAVTVAHALVDNGQAAQVDEELANVLWIQGEHRAAISLLTKVHQDFPQKSAAIYARLVSMVLRLLYVLRSWTFSAGRVDRRRSHPRPEGDSR